MLLLDQKKKENCDNQRENRYGLFHRLPEKHDTKKYAA